MFKCLPTVKGGGTMYHHFGTMTWAFGRRQNGFISLVAMENPPFLVGRYIFSLVDFPASYVSLLECKGWKISKKQLRQTPPVRIQMGHGVLNGN